jgi:hypothetical protein
VDEMGERFKIIFFLALMPFFLAIGHDFYANFLASEEKKNRLESFQIDPESYQNSDFGYIVMKYAPKQYAQIRESFGDEGWNKWVDPILRLYTFLVALIPVILCVIWGLISLIIDAAMGSFQASIRAKSPMSARTESQKDTSFKFKRR